MPKLQQSDGVVDNQCTCNQLRLWVLIQLCAFFLAYSVNSLPLGTTWYQVVSISNYQVSSQLIWLVREVTWY